MYFFNYNLNTNKNLDMSLIKIFGLGIKKSKKIIKKLGFSHNICLKDLSKLQLFNLMKIINCLIYNLGDNLKKLQTINFEKILKLKLIKAFRKLKGLPIRGQRTQTNAKTSKKRKNK
jgi:small subunit ribosomal protein S13